MGVGRFWTFFRTLVIIAIYPCHLHSQRANAFLNFTRIKHSSFQVFQSPKNSHPSDRVTSKDHSVAPPSITWLSAPLARDAVGGESGPATPLPTLSETRDDVCMRPLRHRSPRGCPLDSMNLFVRRLQGTTGRGAAQRMCMYMYVRRLPAVGLARAAGLCPGPGRFVLGCLDGVMLARKAM